MAQTRICEQDRCRTLRRRFLYEHLRFGPDLNHRAELQHLKVISGFQILIHAEFAEKLIVPDEN